MEKKDFKETLELLGKMFDIRKDFEKIQEKAQKEIKEKDDEYEASDLAQELQRDYESIMEWAFGKEFQSRSREESLNKWKKSHPNLKPPRVLFCDDISPDYVTMIAMIDIIPLYDQWKKSKI